VIALNASKQLVVAQTQIGQVREQVVRAGHGRVSLAADKLGDLVGQLLRGVETLRHSASTHLEFFMQPIVGLGPEATLKRGYSIVRDPDERPPGTRRQAEIELVLQIEFQDGRLWVSNQQAAKEPNDERSRTG
jgi:exodeoxyribonuclease VII large subunit